MSRARLLLSTLPVFGLLVAALSFDLGQRVNARLSEVGQGVWDGYALLRVAPEKPECDPASFVVPASAAPASGAPAEDDLLAGLDGQGDAPVKDAISPEAVLAAKAKCESQHALYAETTSKITGGLTAFDAVHDAIERFVVFGNDVFTALLITLLLVCSTTASALRMHIGLRSPANRSEYNISEGLQLVASLLLFHSVFTQWQIDQASGEMRTGGVQFHLWMVGFAAMAVAHIANLARPPADLTEGGSPAGAAATVPLYAFMTLIAGGYFLLFEDHPAGLAIYTQLLAAHPLLYIPVGLYVWIGMLMKQTQVAPMTFDLLRPWRLPPELLAFVVVALAAVPTAYSGASGIFVMAVGGLVYQELRRAGARRQLALAATAMSGSLGVVLRPCLLVVIVASLNKDVTTDELYGWGLWVYLATAAMFLAATLLLRRGEQPMQLAPVSEAVQGMKSALRRLAPYGLIVAGVLVFYAVGLGTFVDEHTAPQVLPVVVLALLVYDRYAARRASTGPTPGFGHAAVEASAETSGHIGALLIMMACSVAIGGVIERSEVMHLVPETFGSPAAAMAIIVGILVIVGMTMDPYGAVILVSASFATIAYRNGIHPAHFWMVVLVAFELGYLTPPVALNQLLARSVVGEAEWAEARREGTSFFSRNESVIVPCAVMAIALLGVAFIPLAFY